MRIMAKDINYIDISGVPDLLRIAEEVRTTRKPHILRRDSEDMAVLIPVTPTRHKAKRTKTRADYEAFHAAAGGWKGLIMVAILNAAKQYFVNSCALLRCFPSIVPSCNALDAFAGTCVGKASLSAILISSLLPLLSIMTSSFLRATKNTFSVSHS